MKAIFSYISVTLIGVLFSVTALSQPVSTPDSESDDVFWDVSHWDYHIEVNATSEGECVPGICDDDKGKCIRKEISLTKCLVEHVCKNCSASCTGTCTIGNLGRLYGWDIESENPKAPDCSKTTTCKKGICKKSATFSAYVFYFGKLQTRTLTAEAEVKCQ